MVKNIIIMSLLFFLWGASAVAAVQYLPNWGYQGSLEAVGDNYIIVNDSRYILDSNLKYFALSGKYVSKYDFLEGTSVTLSLDEQTRKVNALWLVDAELP